MRTPFCSHCHPIGNPLMIPRGALLHISLPSKLNLTVNLAFGSFATDIHSIISFILVVANEKY